MTNLQSLSYYWPELILIVFILAALITDLCLEKLIEQHLCVALGDEHTVSGHLCF